MKILRAQRSPVSPVGDAHARRHSDQTSPRAAVAIRVPRRAIVAAHNPLLRDALEAALGDGYIVEPVESVADLSIPDLDHTADVLLVNMTRSAAATIDRVREIAASCPALKIVIVDVEGDETELADLLQAGASGLLLETATVDEIRLVTRAVLAGATVIPESVTRRVFSQLADQTSERAAAPALADMTRRERQIAALVAEGLTNKEIAARLNIATFTVKSHVHSLLQKLGLQTRGQVARAVLRCSTVESC